MSFSLSHSHFPGFPRYFHAHAPTFAVSKPKQHSSSKNQIHGPQAGTCPMSSLERAREASIPSDQPPNSRSSFLPAPAPAQASPPLISPTCGPWAPYQYHHNPDHRQRRRYPSQAHLPNCAQPTKSWGTYHAHAPPASFYAYPILRVPARICAVVHELLLVLLASPCTLSWRSNLLEALSHFFHYITTCEGLPVVSMIFTLYIHV